MYIYTANFWQFIQCGILKFLNFLGEEEGEGRAERGRYWEHKIAAITPVPKYFNATYLINFNYGSFFDTERIFLVMVN